MQFLCCSITIYMNSDTIINRRVQDKRIFHDVYLLIISLFENGPSILLVFRKKLNVNIHNIPKNQCENDCM
jgi:hypothetical protein